MALVVNTNVASIQAQYNVSKTNQSMQDAMGKLSSGTRLNSAGDDAAGLSIAERMTSQIKGLTVAVRNANDAANLAATAEGAMAEVSEMLQRIRELAIQSANGTNSSQDRENINSEVSQLISEIDRVVGTTTFNATNLLDGTFQRDMQIGFKADETLNVSLSSLASTRLGSINGVATAGSVTEASAKGVESSTTKTQLTFNGSDTYEFKLNIATAAGTGVYLIKGDVSNNSASDIVSKINDAIRDNTPPTGGTYAADGASTINVSFSGNVVTIENTYGGQIDVAQNGTNAYSASGSTIGYTSVAGATGSQNLVLGTANAFAGTEIQNDNSYTAATAATVGLTETAAGQATDVFEITLDDSAGNTLTVTGAALTGTPGNDDSLQSILTAFNNLGDKKGYAMALASNTLTVSRADGVNFKVALGANASITAGGEIKEDVSATAAALTTTGVTTTDGVAAVGDEVSNMYLEFTSADTYTFDFKDSAGTPNTTGTFDVVYDGSASSLSAVASQIQTKINAAFDSQHDMTATVENGRVKISDANGKAFLLQSFASVGNGTVMASTDAGQGDATIGDGVLLDDTTYANTAQTTAAGTPDATVATLTLSAGDRYAFNISDGSATAVISDFAADIATTATTGDVAGEINARLKAAGLDSIIVAAADATTAGKLTLTHKLGKELSITNFRSESTGTMKVEATGTNNTGFTKFLDDGDGGSLETVSGISVASASDAAGAIDVIDRALEDVNIERSKLGAIINRLDYTVSNLGNIIVNTEASKSAITDADFAAESAKLAKNQILLQAGTAMLAQANASQQTVLSLLG